MIAKNDQGGVCESLVKSMYTFVDLALKASQWQESD